MITRLKSTCLSLMQKLMKILIRSVTFCGKETRLDMIEQCRVLFIIRSQFAEQKHSEGKKCRTWSFNDFPGFNLDGST